MRRSVNARRNNADPSARLNPAFLALCVGPTSRIGANWRSTPSGSTKRWACTSSHPQARRQICTTLTTDDVTATG